MTIVYVPVAVPVDQAQVAAAPDTGRGSTPQRVFDDAIVQLAAISPLAALAALSPQAALAALSPVLQLFNPAVNARAALLAFNPAAKNALAVSGGKLAPPWTWPL